MLDRIKPGSVIFLDATIFVYHFTGASENSRELLKRCEAGTIKGVTSVVVLAEVAHRLLMIEGVMKGIVSRGNLSKKMAENPTGIKTLTIYQEQVDRIPLMGIKIESLELSTVLRSADLRRRYGLMVNDSLVAMSAIEIQADGIATADGDFDVVHEISVFHPGDVQTK
jgi:predicted nucleic acid-binding protein